MQNESLSHPMKTESAPKPISTYGNPPKSLVAFAQRHQDKIREVGDERGTEDGYWIYLKAGFCWDDQGLHSLHENTVSDIIRAFGSVMPCRCKDCAEQL